MSRVIFQPTVAGNWERIYHQKLEAQKIDNSTRKLINPLVLPVLAESRILVGATASDSALATWRHGGRLTPILNCGGTDFAEADLPGYSLPCNGSRLIVLPQLASTYKLRFACPWWFDEITLSVYQYTGSVIEEPDAFLDDLRSQLVQIGTKLDDLTG